MQPLRRESETAPKKQIQALKETQAALLRRNSDMGQVRAGSDLHVDIKKHEKSAQVRRAGSPRDDAKNELKEELEKGQAHIGKIFDIDKKDTV